MSSHVVKDNTEGSILIANDLLTGHTVYRTVDETWGEALDDAQVLFDQDIAVQYLERALSDVNTVVDPYLVATDASGRPLHIREAIRTMGPTIRMAS